MASVGMELKLKLKAGAIPTIFPETEAYKASKKAPLNPNDLGPGKHNRAKYGAYSKRNQKPDPYSSCVEEPDVCEEMSCEQSPVRISDPESHFDNVYSQSSQTSETVVFRPTEHKGFTVKPQGKDKSVGAMPVMSDVGTDPTCFESESSDAEDDEMNDAYVADDADDDPDWEPEDDSDEEYESGDEENVWVDCSEQTDRPYLVYESCLLPLLLMCSVCGDRCTITKKSTRGGQLRVTTICGTGHWRTWDSSPNICGTPLINLVVAGAMFFSGVCLRKFVNCLSFIKVPILSYRTYMRLQSIYILPAVDNVWKKTQARLFEMRTGKSLRLGGDARCCSPGHTAKYGSYTLMDLETNHVLDVQLVQSTCTICSEGNGDLVVAKWLSIGNHVVNRHDGHGDLFPRCLHGPIDRSKKWIKAGSKAHKELLLITERKRFVADIRMLSPTEQTSALEAQHKVVCQFAPKFLSFSYAAMKQRLHLAALHSVANANRKQAETRQGEKRYRLSYPKYKAGHHVVKAVKENCTYDYVDELMAELLRMKEEYKSDANARAASGNILFSPPPLSSSANRILKSEAVQNHRSRFN
ncbi:uncharacterized protein LOC127864520 [Dreissena polymorpha]|nr:uncharacterized protein LOC127864520 [Dreissena polymorpha]